MNHIGLIEEVFINNITKQIKYTIYVYSLDKEITILQEIDDNNNIYIKENIVMLNEKSNQFSISHKLSKRHQKWIKMYELAKKYYSFRGNLKIPFNFKTLDGIEYNEKGYPLGEWLSRQKLAYKDNKLEPERKELLDNLNIISEIKDLNEQWHKMYALATVYYNTYGNLKIPFNFKTLDGININSNGCNLGKWLNNQKQLYRSGNIEKERAKLLDQICIDIEKHDYDSDWLKMYEILKRYYSYYGQSEVPKDFKTINGIDYNPDGNYLSMWVSAQRNAYNSKKLSSNRQKLLEEINFNFKTTTYDNNWLQIYRLVAAYYKANGNTNILQGFKTKDGINYDVSGYDLGAWISRQKLIYKNGQLDINRQKLLEQININLETKDLEAQWQRMYELAKIYYNKYGHLNIQKKFKTINGIDYDEKGYNLGNWIGVQKRNYMTGKILLERKLLLEELGVNIEAKDNDAIWYNMYNIAKVYYKYYGNLKVPENFKTINGIDYDENGYDLEDWIKEQKKIWQNNKLISSKSILLRKIGFFDSSMKRKAEDIKRELCIYYNIKYEQVKNLSYEELLAKTMYLLDNNIPLMTGEKVNQLYNMSSTNMQSLYGLTTEELIYNYRFFISYNKRNSLGK